MMVIKNKHLRLFGYGLLLISIVAFFLTWLQWYFGIPATILLIFAFYKVACNIKDDQRTIHLSVWVLVLIALVVISWVLLSGVGGAFPQKPDLHWRNAILHDLINYPWPVRYTDGFDSSLTYYIGFWMVPALFGKIIAITLGTQAGWIAANVASAIYCMAMIFVVTLLLMSRLNVTSHKKMLLVLGVLVFFSGMDILPTILNKILDNDSIGIHLEWWNYIQYSANTTQLGWVFNQAVPAWLATSLLIHEEKVNNYAFLGLLLLPYAPLPLVGVVYLMVVEGFRRGLSMAKTGKLSAFFLQIFTAPNIIGALIILPIYYLYYSTNMAATNTASYFNEFHLISYLGFIIFEFAFVAIMIWRHSFRSPFFLPSIIGLFIIPLFKFGGAQDFCMRASIPLLFILMLYTMDYLVNSKLDLASTRHGINKQAIPLLIVLLIGAATPLDEYRASYLQIIDSGSHCISIFADKFKTLNNGSMERDNFITKDASNTFFYQHLAKGDKK